MKEIELKGIRAENYKNFAPGIAGTFSANIPHRAEISGPNGCGKSTLMDAYLDVMTGKMSDGSVPDGIRPIADDGKEMEKTDIIRSLTLEIDGTETEISKITRQKWRKPRGQSEAVFDGNETKYQIDGYEYSAKQFADYMQGIIPAETLYMCSNARAFLNVLDGSTAEARKALERLSGFDTDSFIESAKEEFSEVADIIKGHPVEDALRQLKKQLTAQRKNVDAKLTEISYEKSRVPEAEDADTAVLAAERERLNAEIAEIGRQEAALDDAAAEYDALSAEAIRLKERQKDMLREASDGIMRQRNDAEAHIRELKEKRRGLEYDLRGIKAEMSEKEAEATRLEERLKELSERWEQEAASEFDESEIEGIKAETFDESTLTCPTCGQEYPEERKQQLREAFADSKKARLALTESRYRRFYEEKDKTLADIERSGNAAREAAEKAAEDKAEAERMAERAEAEISAVDVEIAGAQKALDALPESADLSGDPAYQALMTEIAEKTETLGRMEDVGGWRQELRRKRKEATDRLQRAERGIGRAEAAEDEKLRRVAALEAQLRELNAGAAELERRTELLRAFSRERNGALAAVINPHFREFRFIFLDWTIDGNPVETCRMLRDGIDYAGLNDSDKAICETDLLRGFQEMADFRAPIWLDRAESINAGRIPETGRQLITLRVTEKGPLAVREVTA